MLTGDRERVSLSSEVIYEEEGKRTAIPHSTDFSHRPSVSCYAPQNRHSESFHICTDADFLTVGVPLEAAGHIGIHASPTRITDRTLYLTEALRLQAVEDGIRKFRAYEFEVKKTSVTNGSFWISDSCSGDTVEKLS